MHTVSVIIPTYNGAETLRELLAVLKLQSLQPDEILVVDSSSSDASPEVAREYGAEVHVISQKEFDHGGTRTRMARLAKGDILVFFTQDAIPATRDALEKLVHSLVSSPEVAAAYGRQLPHKDANYSAAHLRGFNYPADSNVRGYEDRHVMGIKTIFISNSFAAYKKKALAGVGYFENDLIFGEDTCTVGRLLPKGYKVAYVAEAAVYHSHNHTWLHEFKRSFDIGVLHAREQWLIDTYGTAEGRGMEYVRSELLSLWRTRKITLLFDFVTRTGLKFLGYKAGRNYISIPEKIIPSFSMHRNWWNRKK